MQIEQDKKKTDSSKMRVRVAIRIRPMNNKQEAREQSTCVQGFQGGRLVIGSDREFKFDSVFTPQTPQDRVFKQCVLDLVLSCFDGYNAAVLAYGQTGSGKTYTMGTANVGVPDEQMGIIPRVIRQLFREVEKRSDKVDFVIKACFLEIYNEQIIDLLGSDYLAGAHGDKTSATAAIRQQKDGSISIYGITQQKVESAEQLLALLQRGATHRSTASTLMNDSSSRSHAIFTIFIEQHFIADLYKNTPTDIDQGFVTAKFHFVDLAGSERIKKTGATGSTLREGININMGLLCLGNVISALTDPQKKGNPKFVPYRDSKLTRILQDSLGGNSNTYMIACVSPAQSNYQQSLSTLKYAARAMNIKNTPVVNRDPQSAMISQLKQKLFQAEVENKRLRALVGQSGIPQQAIQNISRHHNVFEDTQKQETLQLRRIVAELQQKVQRLSDQLLTVKNRSNNLELQSLDISRDRDLLRMQLDQILKSNPMLNIQPIAQKQINLLESQLHTIQALKHQLVEKEIQYGNLQTQFQKAVQAAKRDQDLLVAKTKQVHQLKKEVVRAYKQRIEKRQQAQQTSRMMSMNQQTDRMTLNLNASFSREEYDMHYRGSHMQLPSSMPHIQYNRYVPQQTNRTFLNTQRIFGIEQQANLEQDTVFLSQSNNYAQQSHQAHSQIHNVSGQIHERQRLLKQITNNQVQLQYQLIAQMKEEYHKKIMVLERQKQKLERDMANVARTKDQKILTMIEKDRTVTALRAKKQNLEQQLKQFRKKQKEQHGLQRLVQQQKGRITELSKQIKAFKQQKLDLNKKLKEDKEKFDRFKAERYKQLMFAKKATIEKEQQLRRMVKETQKTHQTLLKKQEEAKQLRKANDTLREILQPKPKPFKRGTFTPMNNLSQTSINYQLIVESLTQRVIFDIERSSQHQKYAQDVKLGQVELDRCLDRICKLKVQIQRTTMKLNCTEGLVQKQQLKQQLDQLNDKLNDAQSESQLVEDKVNFSREKLSMIYPRDLPKLDMETQLIYNKSYDSIESMRRFLRLFVDKLIETFAQQYRDRKLINQMKAQIESLNERIQQMDQHLIQTTTQHQQSLAQLRHQLMLRSSFNEDQPNSALLGPTIPALNLNKKVSSNQSMNQKKYYQRKIKDLNKKVKQLTMESDQLRRKYETVASKYQGVKKLGNKDKFIGVSDDIRIPTLKERRVERHSINMGSSASIANLSSNSLLLDEVSDMWSGLNTTTSVNNLSRFKVNPLDERRIHTEQDQIKQESNKWDCVATLEGHGLAVLSLVAFSKCLISTSAKNIRLWDIQTNKVITNVSSGEHLNGFVKSVVLNTDKGLMLTACQKNITVWDLVNMDPVATFKGHKDQIRALHMHNGILFSGGKGSATSPGLLVWDFRSNAPVEQKQRNQDIFSLASYRSTLYMGTRNHQVRRLNLQTMQSPPPFQNPHFDAVTCLTTLNSYLISGSKDKNLRLWGLDTPGNSYKSTIYAHNDYINTIVRDSHLSIFYSGAKDGQVKAGMISKERIDLVGSIDCHSDSVNCVASLEEGDTSCGFITGSNDKTIKIWKASADTQDNLQTQILYDSS